MGVHHSYWQNHTLTCTACPLPVFVSSFRLYTTKLTMPVLVLYAEHDMAFNHTMFKVSRGRVWWWSAYAGAGGAAQEGGVGPHGWKGCFLPGFADTTPAQS
jgi:hypothetical protein